MNLEHFQNSPSGRLLQFGQGETAYHAFVPNPLPRGLQLDAELVHTLSDADRALGEPAGLGRNMPNPQLLIGPFIRRAAVLSSRIEGTQANLKDLYAYEAGQLSLPGVKSSSIESDVHEVNNYVHAMKYGLERIKTLPVSLRFIRELHERLMTGVRGEKATPGEFRRSQNWIGRPGCTLREAEYVPPPVTEWMLYFLRGVAEQSRDAIVRAKRLQDLKLEWKNHFTKARNSALLLRLIDSLFESPVLTIPIAKELLDVTYPSAQRNVDKLVKVNILRPWKKTSYGKVFFAEKILRITGGLATE